MIDYIPTAQRDAQRHNHSCLLQCTYCASPHSIYRSHHSLLWSKMLPYVIPARAVKKRMSTFDTNEWSFPSHFSCLRLKIVLFYEGELSRYLPFSQTIQDLEQHFSFGAISTAQIFCPSFLTPAYRMRNPSIVFHDRCKS